MNQLKEKQKRGGKRAGSGRPKKNITSTISIRADKNIVDVVKKKHSKNDLQRLGREWLISLSL